MVVTRFEAKDIIAKVYKDVYEMLPDGGVFLNGDFIEPETVNVEYEAGRLTIDEHLTLLRMAGFPGPICVREFENDLENPTTAHNYACIKAIK